MGNKKNTKNDGINRVKEETAYIDHIKGLKRSGNRPTIIMVNNFAITKSIYKDKNNNKFKNKLVKAFRNMHLQYYIDIHKIS